MKQIETATPASARAFLSEIAARGHVLEIVLPTTAAAKRALLRGVCRRAARLLRDELAYPGAALALEAYAEGLRTPEPDDDYDPDETTLVDIPLATGTGCYPNLSEKPR